MSELTDFLAARLAEDAAVARKVAAPLPGVVGLVPVTLSAVDKVVALYVDPARVLVEVEAKRAIVALHSGPEFGYPDKHLCVDSLIRDDLCETLGLLASVYRDHPDYQEGWAL